jgi:hypothetical protein
MPTNRYRYLFLLCFWLLCCWIGALLGGCASSASIPAWQHNVETYAAEKGDPEALRDVTLKGDRRGFAVIGQPEPSKSTDVNGVLLGHKTIDNRPWFIYLVGLVKQQKVTEIHLAAVTFENGKAQWRLSNKDDKATSAYLHYNEQLWTQKHTSKDKPPADYTTFPRDADAFDLKISGTQVVVTHPPSGAKWSLALSRTQ